MTSDPAFSEFVHSQWTSAVRLAYGVTLDRHWAEDMAQDAFVRMWPRWHRVRDERPEAYLRQVVINVCLTAMRRRVWTERATDLIGERGGVEDHMATDVAQRDELVRAMTYLSPRQRAAVVLRYAEDQDEMEVARILGCSVGSVKSHTSRGIAKLRSRLRAGRDEQRDLAARTR